MTQDPKEPESTTLRHYRLLRKLGQGGMGVVYEAIDERLHRTVAIKRIRETATDPTLQERLWREARTAAGINHPNICQVYEVGEENGELFIAMELLEGEPLSTHIESGPIPVREALRISTEILAALGALHARTIVHRDLKPSNVILTPHGAKLLDFGLARARGTEAALPRLTQTGLIVGTPNYMAPELWSGEETLGPPADIFSMGALLFEMVTGELAFTGKTLPEICRAILNHDPAALIGGRDADAVDRVLQRALSKLPEDRYQSAEAMVRDIQEVLDRTKPVLQEPVIATKRLMALPFRLLRPDPEIDFLAYSLPDAMTSSLSGVPNLIVRSSAAASGITTETLDLSAIAEANVDAVICGTLLRVGDQVRANVQLLAAPSGTVIQSFSSQFPLEGLFQFQDKLAHQIIESLELDDGASSSQPLQQQVPKDADAYEAYLRANHLGTNMRLLKETRDLYLTCLNIDPHYAPAWAQLGRVYRVMAKYEHGDPDRNSRRAEEAFQMALDADPDLDLAHNLLTNLEVERGQSQEALNRLLRHARNRATNPETFAGLVMACRFCGLLRASVAADRRARRLLPGIRTSVPYTYYALGDYVKAMLHDEEDMRFVTHYALAVLGREAEAARQLRDGEHTNPPGVLKQVLQMFRAALENNYDLCLEASERLLVSGFQDPEGRYFQARCLAQVRAVEPALELFCDVVKKGFCCHEAAERDPWCDAIRDDPRFIAALASSREQTETARAIYRAGGGEELLGIPAEDA